MKLKVRHSQKHVAPQSHHLCLCHIYKLVGMEDERSHKRENTPQVAVDKLL